MLIICTKSFAQDTVPPPNPFAPFADVFPGQPGNGVEARGFSCVRRPYGAYRGLEDCTCILATGAFSLVEVIISEGTIRQTDFTMRGSTLRIGDLAMLWGIPDVHKGVHTPYFYWPGNGILATTISYSGQFSFFLALRSVLFTDFRVPN
jgi:hypothetical protein